jgi:hypothetical protein
MKIEEKKVKLDVFGIVLFTVTHAQHGLTFSSNL